MFSLNSIAMILWYYFDKFIQFLLFFKIKWVMSNFMETFYFKSMEISL